MHYYCSGTTFSWSERFWWNGRPSTLSERLLICQRCCCLVCCLSRRHHDLRHRLYEKRVFVVCCYCGYRYRFVQNDCSFGIASGWSSPWWRWYLVSGRDCSLQHSYCLRSRMGYCDCCFEMIALLLGRAALRRRRCRRNRAAWSWWEKAAMYARFLHPSGCCCWCADLHIILIFEQTKPDNLEKKIFALAFCSMSLPSSILILIDAKASVTFFLTLRFFSFLKRTPR